MTSHTETEKLREEFHKMFKVTDDETGEFLQYAERSNGMTIADWWLNKLSSSATKIREEERKEIAKKFAELFAQNPISGWKLTDVDNFYLDAYNLLLPSEGESNNSNER